ncbi:hypothetical protein AB0392_30080 [Nonomuraea angiospora]|uniref:hypothetical protein n=1 Tax=Nonomuraea angiospora TaxID=46172 RepID=UPI00344F9363
MAGARIAQHFGRPGTPDDQAWIESLFGHIKDEHHGRGEAIRAARRAGLRTAHEARM